MIDLMKLQIKTYKIKQRILYKNNIMIRNKEILLKNKNIYLKKLKI